MIAHRCRAEGELVDRSVSNNFNKHMMEGAENKMTRKGIFGLAALVMFVILASGFINNLNAHVRAHNIAAEMNYLNQVDGSLTTRFHTRLVDVNIDAIDRVNICDIVLAHGLACVSVNVHRTIDATIDRDHATHIDNPNLQHFTVHRLSIDPATRNKAASATQQTAHINLKQVHQLNRVSVLRHVSLEVINLEA
jgi:hypothetical protein